MSRFAAHVVAPALVLGLLIGGALEVSAPAEAHAVTAALEAPLAPKPPDLSDEERRAVEDRKAGRPFDQRAYKRAEQKRKQTEKFEGERNRQKRGTQTKPGAPAPKPAPAPAPAPAPKPDAPAPTPAAPPKEPPPAPKPGPAPEPAPPKAKPGPPPS